MTTHSIGYGTHVAMTVTNLHSLASDSSDPFSAWQSDRVDNTSVNALDYEVSLEIAMASTAKANDSAAYLYVIPWYYNGTSWVCGGNFSTTTLPTGSEGTASISDPNSMRGPISLPYVATGQKLSWTGNLASIFGGYIPDGWSLAFRNCTGAALASSGSVVSYKPLVFTSA